MAKAQNSDIERRWEGRPVTAALVRGVAFLTPVVASTVFAFVVTATLPPPSSPGAQIAVWLIVSVASTGVLILVDGLARRLLPLAALLSLSMVFPDRAPSRFKVARRVGGQRNLEARLAEARRMGEDDTAPARAAETIIELVTALQRHDRRTRGHAERVHLFTEMLAQELKLPDDDRDRLRWAALVHDIGKLEVPSEVLNKPGRTSGSFCGSIPSKVAGCVRRCAGGWAAGG